MWALLHFSDGVRPNKKATKTGGPLSSNPKLADEPSPAHRKFLPAGRPTCDTSPMVLLMQSHGRWLVDQADSLRHFRVRTKQTMRRHPAKPAKGGIPG